MSVLGIHTPTSDIIKSNYPGLLMQCKAYRPVKCDVRVACASMMPLSPQDVGIADGDVAPEDMFNPILYKAISNKGMSQIEQYIHAGAGMADIGPSVKADYDGITDSDDFSIYYGLLSQTHEWLHANPQSGFSLNGVRPLVYERLYSVGDNGVAALNPDRSVSEIVPDSFVGAAKEMPFINCTAVRVTDDQADVVDSGFTTLKNAQVDVPAPRVFCGVIIVPPSRLHQLFYRMVVEWTLEFSTIRSFGDITTYGGLGFIGNQTHLISYSFGSKELLKESTGMVDTSSGTEIKRVM